MYSHSSLSFHFKYELCYYCITFKKKITCIYHNILFNVHNPLTLLCILSCTTLFIKIINKSILACDYLYLQLVDIITIHN